MANNLDLAQYLGVIAPIAGLSHLISSIWPAPPTSADDDIPQATTVSDPSQEVAEVANVWDRSHTITLTETELSPQYITVEQISTVTETSSYQGPTVTVFKPTTVTETKTSTIRSISPPSATSIDISKSQVDKATHPESKARLNIFLYSTLISLLLGILLTHYTGLWIPQVPVNSEDINQDADTSSEKDENDQEDTEEINHCPNTDTMEFWAEKRAYVDSIAGNRERNVATIVCLRTIFDSASVPLGQQELAEELAKYIRTRAVENDELAHAIECPSDDHSRAFTSAKRIASSHVARYPETSVPIIAQLLLRDNGPFVDNVVLRDWLNEIRENAILIQQLSAHTFATCPDDLHDPAIRSQRYPRSPIRSHHEASVGDSERGRKRLPKPSVSSRAASVDRHFTRRKQQHNDTDNSSAFSTELAPHRERLRQVIVQLKGAGVEEAWIANNLPAVHVAIKTTGAVHAAVDNVKKLYAETVLKPELASFVNELGPLEPSSDPYDPATSDESTLPPDAAASSDLNGSEDAESSRLIPEIQIDDADAVADEDTGEDVVGDNSEDASQAQESIEPIGCLSPGSYRPEESYREQDVESDSSSDDSSELQPNPTPAPRPGWVESIRGRRVSSLDLGDAREVATDIVSAEPAATTDKEGTVLVPVAAEEQPLTVFESEREVEQDPTSTGDLVEEAHHGQESVNKLDLEQVPSNQFDSQGSLRPSIVPPSEPATVYRGENETASNNIHKTTPELPFTIDPELVDQLIIDEIEIAPVVEQQHAKLPMPDGYPAEDDLGLANNGKMSSPEQHQYFEEITVEVSQPLLVSQSFISPTPGLPYEPFTNEDSVMEGLEATGFGDEITFFTPQFSAPQQSPEPQQHWDTVMESVEHYGHITPELTAPLTTLQPELTFHEHTPGLDLKEDAETGIAPVAFESGSRPKTIVEGVKEEDMDEQFEDVFMPNGQTIKSFQNRCPENVSLVEGSSTLVSSQGEKAGDDVLVDTAPTVSAEGGVGSRNTAADHVNNTLDPRLSDPPRESYPITQEDGPILIFGGGMDANQFDPPAPNTDSLPIELPSQKALKLLVPDYTKPPAQSTNGQFTNPTSSSLYVTDFSRSGFGSIQNIPPSAPYVPLGIPLTSAQIAAASTALGPYITNAHMNLYTKPQPPQPYFPSIPQAIGRDDGDSDADTDSEAPAATTRQRKPIRQPKSRISKLKSQNIDPTQFLPLAPLPTKVADDSEAETDIIPEADQPTHGSKILEDETHQPANVGDVDEDILADKQHDSLTKANQAAEQPKEERKAHSMAKIFAAQRSITRAKIAARRAAPPGKRVSGGEQGEGKTAVGREEANGMDDGAVETIGEDEVLW